jgi:hypothetical protein
MYSSQAVKKDIDTCTCLISSWPSQMSISIFPEIYLEPSCIVFNDVTETHKPMPNRKTQHSQTFYTYLDAPLDVNTSPNLCFDFFTVKITFVAIWQGIISLKV